MYHFQEYQGLFKPGHSGFSSYVSCMLRKLIQKRFLEPSCITRPLYMIWHRNPVCLMSYTGAEKV